MLHTIPDRLTPRWIKAECDPSGEVEFYVEPLDGLIQMMCTTKSLANTIVLEKVTTMEGKEISVPEIKTSTDVTVGAALAVRYSLKGLKGVIDSSTGKPLELKYDCIKQYGVTYKVLREDCLHKIARVPGGLFSEIVAAVQGASDLTEAENKDLDFTQTSSSENSTSACSAMGTKPNAGMGAKKVGSSSKKKGSGMK